VDKWDKRESSLKKYLSQIVKAFLVQGHSVYRRTITIPEFSGEERIQGIAIWLPPESDIPPESEGGLPRVIYKKMTLKSAPKAGKMKNVISDYVEFLDNNSSDNCWIFIISEILGNQPNYEIWEDILRFGIEEAIKSEKECYTYVTQPELVEFFKAYDFETTGTGKLDSEIDITALCRKPLPFVRKDISNHTLLINSTRDAPKPSPPTKKNSKKNVKN